MTEKEPRMKRPPQTVFFAECKENPGKLQLWLPSHSIIYTECHSCGVKTSYAASGNCVNYRDHFNLYQIETKKRRGEDWDAYWNRAREEILKDLQKYVYTSD
jgi:hypothetical protein